MATGRPQKEIDKKIFEKLWLLGVQKDGYSSCCYGKTKKCAGYKWRWKNGTPTEEH